MTLEAGLGWAPRGRPLTVADVLSLPEDGQRYELIDGMLVAVAAADLRHARVCSTLWALLDAAAPPHMWAIQAPAGVIIDETTWVEPDVFVGPRGRTTYFEGVPTLVVEVLSRSNRLFDLTTKFDRYERAGVPSYWVVDPHELHLVAWDLREGGYVQVADVTAEQSWTTDLPFPVTIRPGTLLD